MTATCRKATQDQTDVEEGIHVYDPAEIHALECGYVRDQKPIVKKGQHVKKGSFSSRTVRTPTTANSPRPNVLVAFMPGTVYNFEDAIMISEKVVKEGHLYSIHIDEFEIGARDTKLGRKKSRGTFERHEKH